MIPAFHTFLNAMTHRVFTRGQGGESLYADATAKFICNEAFDEKIFVWSVLKHSNEKFRRTVVRRYQKQRRYAF
jgi:hypothetical protein